MSSVTLVESAKLALNELAAGVIENIITINRMFEVLPFDDIDGNALAYNRENVLGDVDVYTVGDTIAAKNPASFTNVTSSLTSIIGDAEVNGLIQATRSGDGNDQKAIQIASKAKSAGRKFQDMLVNGTGSSNQFADLLSLVDPGQQLYCDTNGDVIGTTTNGGPIGFKALDALIDLVVDKDGQVDYIAMNARTIRSYLALLRALGGAHVTEVVTLPSGAQVPSYRQIPIFRNDWIPLTQTRGGTNTCTSVIAGTFDDGSRRYGISGLTAKNAAGLSIEEVGVHQSRDETITRVKWYCGLANYNAKGLAVLSGVTN